MGGIEKDKDTLLLLYEFFCNIMKKYNIDFIPFYGTLLGIIRENEFIDSDDDIDALVYSKNFKKIVKIIRKEKIKTGIIKYKEIIQLFLPTGEGPIDIYFYNKVGEDILIKWDGNLLFSQKYIFPLKEQIFKNKKIAIPFDSKEILKQIYGENYLTPLKRIEFDKIFNKVNTIRRL